MKNAAKYNLRISAISIGIIAIFTTGSALADDQEIKALTQPKSSVQVEVINVDNSSAKFGEYNGLNRQGGYVNGSFVVKGGSGYSQNEAGETTRWSASGQDLGLTSRSANISGGEQGSWNFGVNYDQLQHNITDTYQTPYQGKMGGNSFTLPSNFYLNSNSFVSNATTTTPGGTQALPGAIQGDYQGMNISSTRYNTTVNGTAVVDKDTNFTFEYNNLIQTGAKLGAAASTKVSGSGTGSLAGGVVSQGISILPMPTNTQTDTLNLAYNVKGENSHFTASYFGSFFQNNASNFQWAPAQTATPNYAVNNTMQTLSTMPNNALNQLNLNGGYDFSKATKLTGNFSISNNTQNQGYNGTYDSINYAGTVPGSSLNGVVNTTHADIKVTDQSIKDLTLTALAKFDQRDNLTQSNVYYPIGVNGGVGGPGGSTGIIANAPLSFKQNQLSFGGDYRLTRDQKIGLTLSNISINRWCNQYGAQTTTIATGNYFYNSPSCVTATSSNENKADLNYKIKASEDVNVKLGAGYSNRKSNFDNSVYSMIPQESATTPTRNSLDQPGFYPFFEASRKQYSAKASANWQATEELSFTLGGKYLNDLFYDSTFGVQNGNTWSLNFDATYAYDVDGTVSAYATQQSMQRNLTEGKSSTTYWANNLQTNSTTLGLGFKQAGLVNGKVAVTGDANYSVANSAYSTNGLGVYAATCGTTNVCGALPGIYNNTLIFKLGSSYQLDKNSRVGINYWYQRLKSNDFYYNGYQSGYVPPTVMPTNQTSPSYNINVISANYTYTFD